jgi:hypothetical protein
MLPDFIGRLRLVMRGKGKQGKSAVPRLSGAQVCGVIPRLPRTSIVAALDRSVNRCSERDGADGAIIVARNSLHFQVSSRLRSISRRKIDSKRRFC